MLLLLARVHLLLIITVSVSKVLAAGKYLLGYVVLGTTGLVLLAEKVRVSAVLPGNHEVKTVTTSKWIKIPLQVRSLIPAWLVTDARGTAHSLFTHRYRPSQSRALARMR